MERIDCKALDDACPLAWTRERFDLPDDLLYFDGNSLGVLPAGAASDIAQTVTEEWGQGLIRGWLEADWFTLARRAGDALAPIIGATEGEVVLTDSTSVNIFKLCAALMKQSGTRKHVLMEKDNFPTDGYILEGIIDLLGRDHELQIVPRAEIESALTENTALALLTHVNYRTGEMFDMADLTRSCRSVGVPVVWDLCHSTGAVPLQLNDWDVDYAVGCTYKFLNGGPGSTSYAYISRSALEGFSPVITGWFSHANQFGFEEGYREADSINKMQVGTPQVLSLRGAFNGIMSYTDVSMESVRDKSLKLSSLFIELAEERLSHHGFDLASPRDAKKRGSQISFYHDEGYAICQALIARNVIPDYREPRILRFGITPLYMRYVDVWDCVDIIADIMEAGSWRAFRSSPKSAVT